MASVEHCQTSHCGIRGCNLVKKVLVTGSEGYIGKHLVQMLGNKYEIYKLDLKDPTNPLDIRTINCDLEFDTIVHLAALANVSRSTRYPDDYFDTNVNGTRHLLKNLKYKNFIFASTGSAVGMASPYSISKKMAELIVEDYCKNQNKNFTTFRFYNVTGIAGFQPTNPDGLLASLMRAEKEGVFYVYGGNYNTRDGSAIRDYTHVNEICTALLKAIESPAMCLENLGHGIGTSVKEMVEIYKKINNCNFRVEIKDRRPGDLEISVLDNVSNYMTRLYSIEDLLKTD
jgi:UDP-glucose 4-epimerase